MQRITNEHGLAFTASRPESVEAFDRLTRCYMGFRPDTGAVLQDLLAGDPEMPMALCAQGYFAKLFGSASFSERAAQTSRTLTAHLETVVATDRERQHAAALAAWVDGQMDTATAIWERILLDHPLDGLALRLAHFTHFYSGDGRRIRDSMARILPLWPENHPDYGFLLGMYAFGLEESREYGPAERYGRRAVEINPKDAWSVHAVAHVLEMTERHEEGIAWVRDLEPDWSTVNNFRFHLYWHQSLYHLERGEFDEVFRLYDEQVVSDIESGFYLDICNASALLWRLEMFGLDVGDRWGKLAEVSKRHVDDRELIFVSLHYLMALISNGDRVEATAMTDTIRHWATQDSTQSRICAGAGVALAEAMQDARDGHHAEAVRKIEGVRYAMDGIGGSMAQRDVFVMIMLNAARAGGDAVKARSLFMERNALKPNSSWGWQGYGDAMQALGEGAAAEQAFSKANEIRVM